MSLHVYSSRTSSGQELMQPDLISYVPSPAYANRFKVSGYTFKSKFVWSNFKEKGLLP